MWECGLKYTIRRGGYGQQYVTPCVGVWIEIETEEPQRQELLSLPVWECGLKYHTLIVKSTLDRSLPVWECGLKYFLMSSVNQLASPSLPVWECGLKSIQRFDHVFTIRHSLCGSVD